MTNVAASILQAQELAAGESLAESALYPSAHLLSFVHVSSSSSSWDGDEVPSPAFSSSAARHSLSPQSWQPSHSLMGALSVRTLAKSKSPSCQEPAF